MAEEAGNRVPSLALIGAGIFVRTQYVPRLREVANLLHLKAVWSRTQKSAEAIVPLVTDYAPDVVARWGTEGLEQILYNDNIDGVVIAIAGQAQVEFTLQALKAGKHVIQEKPASSNVKEALEALQVYQSLGANANPTPIWAVAENYRFEPAFTQASKLVKEIGDIMAIEVIAEAPMNSANPYFSSNWRRNFDGGFTLDVGVHFIAGLRMMVGSEVRKVSAIARHVDSSLPAPDNISALFELENNCAGVFVMSISARSRRISWRVVGAGGTVEVERGVKNNEHGYAVNFIPLNKGLETSFYPFSGVQAELQVFASDMKKALEEVGAEADVRSSPVEGARDVAVLEAMLQSSLNNGSPVFVQKIN